MEQRMYKGDMTEAMSGKWKCPRMSDGQPFPTALHETTKITLIS